MGWVQFASPDHVHFGKGAFWGNVVWRHKNKTQTLKLERKKCEKNIISFERGPWGERRPGPH